MNPLMRLMYLYIPEKFKKEKINQLFDITSEVFNDYPAVRNDIDLKVPDRRILQKLSYEQILKEYAGYTGSAVRRLLESRCDVDKLKRSLFDKSYKLGQEIRNTYDIRNFADIRFIIRIIYKIVKIDCDLDRGKDTGIDELVVKNCFFADYYSADICNVMSSVDEGIVVGVSGYRKLQFKQRITEGNDFCRAALS